MIRIHDEEDFSAIDMVEMGIRPANWVDDYKKFDFEPKEQLNFQYQIYSAEFQPVTTNDFKDLKRSTIEDDDQDSNDFEIDPETGERIFHEKPSAEPIFSPTNKWIDDYISNLESVSLPPPQPETTITTDETLLSNIPSTLFENSDPQWFNNFFQMDENSESMIFNEVFPSDEDQQSNMTTTSTSADIQIDSNDDEVSIISTTKLEKIDRDETFLSEMHSRRSNPQSRLLQSQTQQDEEILLRFHIPLSLEQITNSTTEEYNHHLSRLSHLSAEQMHIIKDIRRRGKNKIAAQNCRKRKAVGVEALAEEVDDLKRVKQELEEKKRQYEREIAETRRQYEYLHRQVLPRHQLPPAIRVK